jgi:hypothetical protein
LEEISVAANPLTIGHVKLGYILPLLPSPVVMNIEKATRKPPRRLREALHFQILAVLRKPLLHDGIPNSSGKEGFR